MSGDGPVQLEIVLSRFERLLADVIRGSVRRNSFRPWELEILMDMETCDLDAAVPKSAGKSGAPPNRGCNRARAADEHSEYMRLRGGARG